MMRSLWTAATGMTAQQYSIDTISNNLSNVNTAGYKKETAEFKTLLYQNLQTRTTSANGDNKPISAQVGLGVRNASITSHYIQGPIQTSDEPFDFAINGDGFFQVRTLDGGYAYTRSGHFQMADAGNGNFKLCTTDGLPVLDEDGREIVFDGTEINVEDLSVDENGNFFITGADGNQEITEFTLGLYQFTNPSGLEKGGSTLLYETEASGVAMNESDYTELSKSVIRQKALEMSNVQVADEMVNLIVAQRAYELNSKAITTSDEMLQTANNLKR